MAAAAAASAAETSATAVETRCSRRRQRWMRDGRDRGRKAGPFYTPPVGHRPLHSSCSAAWGSLRNDVTAAPPHARASLVVIMKRFNRLNSWDLSVPSSGPLVSICR